MKLSYPTLNTAAVALFCCVGHCALLGAAPPPAPESTSILAERPEDQADEEAGRIKLKRPGERDFILDLADLTSSSDEQRIGEVATKLLNDKATPIIVVTIESMTRYGGVGMRIETFAKLLFDQWAIGQATLNGQLWNTGVLLLVSRDDRKARIELGAGWKHEQDSLAKQIMDEQIVPRFRQGDFSGGIVAGVAALDKMARRRELLRQATRQQRSTRGAEVLPGGGADRQLEAALGDPPAQSRTVRSTAKAPREGRPENRWRYQFYNGYWWYWTPGNRWAFFDGQRWGNYNSDFANQRARGGTVGRTRGTRFFGGLGGLGPVPGPRGAGGGPVTGEENGSSLFGNNGGMAAVSGLSGTRGSIGGASDLGITAGGRIRGIRGMRGHGR